MAGAHARLLGLAFASADLLVELDAEGRIAFAAGSHPEPSGGAADALTGSQFREWLDERSGETVFRQLSQLKDGQRTSGVEVTLVGPSGLRRQAQFRALRLPFLAPNVSCALSFAKAAAAPSVDPALARERFETKALEALVRTASAGEDLACIFVDIRGLTDALDKADAAQGAAALENLERVLRSHSLDGASAGRLAGDRYALLAREDASPDAISSEVREAGRDKGLTLAPAAAAAVMKRNVDPLANMRALRFTMDSFIRSGGADKGALPTAFGKALHDTLTSAATFTKSVRDRSFELYYQPIVRLDGRAVHHYEALARFRGEASPAESIRMAEELDLVADFDLAVAEKVLSRLRGLPSEVKIAINLSGRSISGDRVVAEVLKMHARVPEARGRLLIEITETAALGDLAGAASKLGALRDVGFKICIDDFGAGAASFDYLRQLPLDVIKIDGRFVEGIQGNERSQTLLRHVVDMCQALNVATVAERIETEGEAEAVKRLGVQYGQGWLFGRPEPNIQRASPAPIAARRRGVVETWS